MSSFNPFKPRRQEPRRRPGSPATPTHTAPAQRPVGALSIYDPIYVGVDDRGCAVKLPLMYRNLLCAGEPGSGKSVALNNIVAHAALCTDAELWLIDGKLVELLPYAPVADQFVGNDVKHALRTLRAAQKELERRYDLLARSGRRKISKADGLKAIVLVIDELAYFSVTVGTKDTREEFITLVRDLVARGRAAGIIVVGATQRPSADIIPTSLRDLFSYRLAFRCTTDSSSDIILGVGWASDGYSAKRIAPEDRGVGFLLAEGGIPGRLKSAYLTDDKIRTLVAKAVYLRTCLHTPVVDSNGTDNGSTTDEPDGGEAA
jgi:S-DNA-T family DNA segregation ATPase FtsK/SpoIIIE